MDTQNNITAQEKEQGGVTREARPVVPSSGDLGCSDRRAAFSGEEAYGDPGFSMERERERESERELRGNGYGEGM